MVTPGHGGGAAERQVVTEEETVDREALGGRQKQPWWCGYQPI